MEISLFNSFAEMVEGMPVEGIMRAVELECRMLEDDLIHRRDEPTDEILSIQSFHRFLKASKEGRCEVSAVCLPAEHEELYRRIVDRLITARELPANAMELFNETFSEFAVS